MRAVAVHAEDVDYFSTAVDAMHKLRASVFGDRLGWDVVVKDAREKDGFDQLGPTYILAISNEDEVAGCARLLPALGPTMLSETFPQLISGGPLAAHSRMIESSRFCANTALAASRGARLLHEATLTLFAGIIEWSIVNGYMEIVTATDVRFERILQHAGWPMRRIGDPCMIGDVTCVAGTLPADQRSFEQVRPKVYRSQLQRIAHRQDASGTRQVSYA
jgi:N-acyl-L-homoserine lactone synthetase